MTTVGECTRSFGRWDFTTVEECKRNCLKCPQCNYISYSKEWNDCSWFFNCKKVHSDVPHFETLQVRTPRPYKLLVVMSGQMRGGKHAWFSAIRNFLGPNHATLALIRHKNDNTHNILVEYATYIWRVPGVRDWRNLLGGRSDWRRVIENRTMSAFSPFHAKSNGIIRPMMHAYVFQHYRLASFFKPHSARFNTTFRRGLLFTYTHIVLTRPDYYYACVLFLPSMIKHMNNTVVIPNVQWNSGVNDKWMLCSSESFEKCFNLYAPFVANPKRFENVTQNAIESFTKTMLVANNLSIQTIQSRMFTIGASPKEYNNNAWGGNQPTTRDEVFGLHVKIVSEYLQTLNTCFRPENIVQLDVKN